MSINLEYNRKTDYIQGFEDLGEFGRRGVMGKQALVLLPRGIYSSWKIPLGYFISENGVKADQLQRIVLKSLELLESCGLKPVGITCDQSRVNQKLFKNLGASSEQPYFIVGENKYFTIYDVPHLIKSLMNNLLNADYIYDNKRVSFKDVRDIYTLDKNSKTGRSLLNLVISTCVQILFKR